MICVTEILDTNYKKVNISDIVDMYEYLTLTKKAKLKSILCKYKTLFDRILGMR